MFDVVYMSSNYWVMNQDESQSYGPYSYAAEAQEKADELNETNNHNNTQQ